MLAKPSSAMELIREHDFRIQKRYGQNFLVDAAILEKIIREAAITKEDHILEIGPGLGTMTAALAESAASVTAVEIDKELIPILKKTLAPFSNVRIIRGDILKLDPETFLTSSGAFFADSEKKGRMKVVANLPYYITTPILLSLLPHYRLFESITVMVQKEVAERLRSMPGTKEYGSLTLFASFYAQARILMRVPPASFIPRPQVDSAVIQLSLYEKPPHGVKEPEKFFRLVRGAFGQRRKTLSNSLSHTLSVPKERIESALMNMGLAKNIRGEMLSLEQFIRLGDLLFAENSDSEI